MQKRMKLVAAIGMNTCNGIEELQETESVVRWKEYIWIMTAPPNISCDCGIFTMANAEHVAYRRAIEYTQADIWYYRQKIVTDIYQKQKQLYSH
ncbi:hypothetical protein CKAN_02509000 [Cinnamomum micranthum f. kanehirae]|uniref:Ubiquitin-like protease family profile domain-containing protein n=1 Tax=Cinnamomum micranthum f. kanehirae TaxID=337451 RepID=A0A3S3N4E3_9MAGN|nr:hypothetical protein CKAN_02509000 [Cinnamomum micranthum f. kanehirae]